MATTPIRALVGPSSHPFNLPDGLFRPTPSSDHMSFSEDEASVVRDGLDACDWSPLADLVETESAYHVHIDLPGVDQRSLQITLGDGVLMISGKRTPQEAHSDTRYHNHERPYGQFSRSFWLGTEVDVQTVDAAYGDGVLHVAVRKAHASVLRRIEVRIEP